MTQRGIPFFNFTFPKDSERLLAGVNEMAVEREVFPCPISNAHDEGDRRIAPLYFELKHDNRYEHIIWSWDLQCAVHKKILEGFASQGFTGYRVEPATVSFQDGYISHDYFEFRVVGWAGVAKEESGMHVVDSCPACHWSWYSPIEDYRNVIDWDQWTGEDFFVVWPLRGFTLCTERVANWLKEQKVKSYRMLKEFAILEESPALSKQKTFGGRLSSFFPEDLAIKYGRPLGLE